MRETIAIILLALLAPLAAAQDAEPTVNDSDYDTSVPADDEAYLNETEAEYAAEPTLSDADFDTTLPPDDQSYLTSDAGENAPQGGSEGGGSGGGAATDAETPGPGLLALLAGVGLLALAMRRR